MDPHARVKIVQVGAGKGRGLVALVPIACGEPCFDEAPLVVADAHSKDIPVALVEVDQSLYNKRNSVLRLALRTVLKGVDEKFWRALSRTPLGLQGRLDTTYVLDTLHLHCPHTRQFSKELWDDLLAVLIANSYASTNGGGMFFLTGSMLNHSCDPNCFLEGSTFLASRAISPGEELTVSYCPPDLSPDMRRKLLSRNYGFKCACERCVL